MEKISRVALLLVLILSGCEWLDPESSNAYLTSLNLTGGVLQPSFSPTVTEYTVTADPGVDAILVIASAAHQKATVRVDNVPVRGGGMATSIPLVVGSNSISVSVAAENGNVLDYTIDVVRPVPTFSVGGLVAGLSGEITLQNNGADNLVAVTDGPFTFAAPLDDGQRYDVTVSSQPVGQTCSVSNGEGTISGGNVVNVDVNCVADTYAVGGSVSGLIGTLVLQNNGADDLSLDANGTFVFATPLDNGAGYDVTVSSHPVGQACAVSNGNGTIAGANVANVSVDCTSNVTGSIFDWEWANPLPQGNTIMDVASDGTQLVIVGTFGTVRTSSDGLNWTTRDAGTGENLNAITWDGAQFVAVGGRGTIANSPDGLTWSIQSIGSTYTLRGIVWNGSQFVAVGQEEANAFGGAIASSPDGVTWSVRNFDLAGAYSWDDIAWNGSRFAAVQFPNFIHSSPDAVTWTTTDFTADNPLFRTIASDGSGFVAMGNGVAYTSPDGTTWTAEAGGSITRAVDVTWDGSEFLAVGTLALYRSPDGSNWSQQVLSLPGPIGKNGATSIFNNGGQYLVTGTNGIVMDSADAVTWNTQSSGEFDGLTDITWSGSQFVAVGHDRVIRTSPDAVTWTTQNVESGTDALFGIAWSGSQYLAVGGGSSGQALTSPDGITWTPHDISTSFLQLSSVVWGGTQFVAVGSDGSLFSSPDGATWTAQTNGVAATDNFFEVSWNGSLFVATGSQNAGTFDSFIMTSPDGIAWTIQVLPWWAGIQSLSWNGSQFVGVSSQAVATSVDGLTWTIEQTSDTFLRDVTWTGSRFVAVGGSPTVRTSPDGITWTDIRSISGFYEAIASDGTRTVVVDQTGHVLVNSSL